jgi:hypothetical protein
VIVIGYKKLWKFFKDMKKKTCKKLPGLILPLLRNLGKITEILQKICGVLVCDVSGIREMLPYIPKGEK